MSINKTDLYATLINQLSSFWKMDNIVESDLLTEVEKAKEMTIKSYDKSAKSYYRSLGFSERNSSVYTVFLCHLSRLIGISGG